MSPGLLVCKLLEAINIMTSYENFDLFKIKFECHFGCFTVLGRECS